MAGSSNFQQWNPNANNQESDTAYTNDAIRQDGATAGVFPSVLANKLFFQLSTMSAALGQMLANKGFTVRDGAANVDGNNFAALVAVLANIAVGTDIQTCSFVYAEDNGSSNIYVSTYAPVIAALATGEVLFFKAKASNSGASTFAPNGLTAKPIYGLAHQPLQGGEIIAGSVCCVGYNALLNSGNGAWVLLANPGGAQQVVAASAGLHAMNRDTADARYPSKAGIQVSQYTYAADTGSANAYAIAPTPALSAYTEGLRVQFKAAHANTGASTLAVSGLATKAILQPDGTDLLAGMIPAGAIVDCEYNGTAFQMMSAAASSTSVTQYNSGRYPEVRTTTNKIGITATNGVGIVINTAQPFVMRDTVAYNTTGFSLLQRTFDTVGSKTYHLRFAFNVADGADNFGNAFYTAKGIVNGSFYLVETTDAAYNPRSVAENAAGLDTKLDDMLVAKIVTDSSNNITVTALRNTNARYSYESRRPHSTWAIPTTLTAVDQITPFTNDNARSFKGMLTGTFLIDASSTQDMGWIKLYHGSTLAAEAGFDGVATYEMGSSVTPMCLATLLRGDVVTPKAIRTNDDVGSTLNLDSAVAHGGGTDLSEMGSSLIVYEI